MNQFPSTLLPQNSSPQEMQKAHFDMLAKVNQTRTDAQAAAAAAQAASVPLNNPVAGEPSLGTFHHNSDSTKSTTLVVNTGGASTADLWSAATTMTGVPTGAKAAWCYARVSKAAATPVLVVEAASGYTLSPPSTAANVYKYEFLQAVSAGVPAIGMIRVPLDASGQFKWCTDLGAVLVQIGSAVDYEM